MNNGITNKHRVFIDQLNELIWRVSGGNKKKFARDLGVNYDTVRCWCNGDYLPGSDTLILLHEKFKVSLDRLLLGKDPRDSFMEEWPPEVQRACGDVKTIMEKGSSDDIIALTANIRALKRDAEHTGEKLNINNLEKDMEKLKSFLHELRRQEKKNLEEA